MFATAQSPYGPSERGFCAVPSEPRSLLFSTPCAREASFKDTEVENAGQPTPTPPKSPLSGSRLQDFAQMPTPCQKLTGDGTPYSSQHDQYISTPQGLLGSPEFQQFLRAKPTGFLERVVHRMKVYKHLRRVDPDGFRKLWDNPTLKEYTCTPMPAFLAACEYLLSTLILIASLWYWMSVGSLGALLLTTWGILQLSAWWLSYTSVLGWFMGCFSVVNTSHPDHQNPAGFGMLLVVNLLELCYVLVTLGLGLLTSSALRCTARRQCVAEALLGVSTVRETAGPIQYSQYWPAPTHST